MYFIFENRYMAFYSRNLLLSLRNSWKSANSVCNQPPLSSLIWQTLTSLGIRATRRVQRGGNYLRQRTSLTTRPIANLRRTRSEIPNKVKTKRVIYGNLLNIQSHTSCDRATLLRVNNARHGSRNLDNLVMVKTTKPGPTLPKTTPNCMVLNARLLVKPDVSSGLSTDLSSNKIDICIVSETWLNSRVSSHLVCPDGYTILRKDRGNQRTGGGVALICRNDWKIKRLEFESDFECLWSEVFTTNCKYFIASLYHPPDPVYAESDLLAHLTETCELILAGEPNARIIISGDINHLNIRDLISQHNLKQLVTKSTRGDKILDVFLTNSPHLWKTPVVFKSLVRSDHLSVMVSTNQPARPERRYVSLRDVREHRKLDLQHKLEAFDWSLIDSCVNLDEATNLLSDSLKRMHDESGPLIKIKVSSRDPPYMTPLIKYLCRKRNKNIKKGHEHDLQERINNLIRKNQMQSICEDNKKHETGSKKWWDTVHKITGRKRGSQNVSSILSPSAINQYFKEINTDPAYSIPQRIPIPPGTRIPALEVHTVQRFLAQQKRTQLVQMGFPVGSGETSPTSSLR